MTPDGQQRGRVRSRHQIRRGCCLVLGAPHPTLNLGTVFAQGLLALRQNHIMWESHRQRRRPKGVMVAKGGQ